ncbi:hypothetical protein [Janthinobacterium lividum]|uniref:hypothetical protein n=1 Tax=Janthinobacterium lividum TaxID=29581 RepID=UPI001F0F5A2E|nr:hypothetical protein [Janthinobacterium lividum]
MILILPLKPQRLFDFSVYLQQAPPGFVAPAPYHVPLHIRQLARRTQVVAVVVGDTVVCRRVIGGCLDTLPCRYVQRFGVCLFLRNLRLQFGIVPDGG